jgi:hypothetical protein
MEKSAMPRSNPLISPLKDGKRIMVENKLPTRQTSAKSKTTLLYDGSPNSDE